MDNQTPNGKFLKIKGSDFSISYPKTPEFYLRTLEHYLKKYNREYRFDGYDCTVSVNDKLDAMKIGLHFDLTCIEYFDGLKFELIDLKSKQKRGGRPKNIVFDYKSGKNMTLNQFKRGLHEEMKPGSLTKNEIMKRKLITKGKLEKAVKEKRIKEVKVGGISYFSRVELAKII